MCYLVILDHFLRGRNRTPNVKIINLSGPGPSKQKGTTDDGVLKVLFFNVGYAEKIPSQTHEQ